MFVILDRASTDGTLDLLRAMQPKCPELNVVYAPENRGVVDAYRRGYHEALQSEADWILEIDAGYSHRPDEIVRYLQHAREGVDCVFGTRFRKGGHFQGGLSRRYLVSRLGGLLARTLLGTNLSDMTSGFQLFRRDALRDILANGLLSRGPFFQTEIKYYARKLSAVEVPITYHPTVSTVRGGAISDALKVLSRLCVSRVRTALPHKLD